jgi:rubredoxin
MYEYNDYVACPCCGERMGFTRTVSVSNANLSEMQTFECKPCGLVVTAEAARGSMRPLIESIIPIDGR